MSLNPKKIVLENKFLKATIASKGAELQSLKNKITGIEHMWNGDAEYWGKHSPVLFPIVGSLKDNTYTYNQKSYTLPRHGFARNMVFVAEQASATKAVFTLTHTAKTLKVYPFQFQLQLIYTISKAAITCTYKVKNTGANELLFSIGAHPAFAVPFTKNVLFKDHYLQFNSKQSLSRYTLANGLVSNKKEKVVAPKGKLAIHPDLFYNDALVFKNLKATQITLGCNLHSNGLHFNFNNFPYFGIWSAEEAPFVCLEPWCGIADSEKHNQQLQKKEGINILATKKSFTRSWSVESF
jgi:galactose mutarotase-like enzyme